MIVIVWQMMYTLDLPRSQFELCDTCSSDIEVPTTPPPRIFSRQLLGYLFELRVDEVDYPRVLELKMCVMEQLAGADRNAEIIRRIDAMFPVVRVAGFVTLSPMFLRLLRDRLVILLNACVRRRQRPLQAPRRWHRPAPAASRRLFVYNHHRAVGGRLAQQHQNPLQSWSLFSIFSVIPIIVYAIRDWFNETFGSKRFNWDDKFFKVPTPDSSDDEMSE